MKAYHQPICVLQWFIDKNIMESKIIYAPWINILTNNNMHAWIITNTRVRIYVERKETEKAFNYTFSPPPPIKGADSSDVHEVIRLSDGLWALSSKGHVMLPHIFQQDCFRLNALGNTVFLKKKKKNLVDFICDARP